MYAHLVFNDVIKTANNKVSSPDVTPYANLGGASDKWGETSITGAQVSNIKFGLL
jgi:hypothetical protein